MTLNIDNYCRNPKYLPIIESNIEQFKQKQKSSIQTKLWNFALIQINQLGRLNRQESFTKSIIFSKLKTKYTVKLACTIMANLINNQKFSHINIDLFNSDNIILSLELLQDGLLTMIIQCNLYIRIHIIIELKLVMQIRKSQFHVTNAKSVSQYAYFEDKNFPTRQNMEDNYIAIDNFLSNQSGLFCILDGHGGSEVSEYCAEVIPNIFEEEYNKEKNNINLVFQRVFQKVDDQLKFVGASQTGSTCCLVFIRIINGSKMCYVANLGDTRAVLCEQNKCRRLTVDHKVSNISEQERIKREGGVILKGRVAGQLAISRALGDLQLKSEGVSNKPDVQEFQITEKTKYLLIASDGLWDVCEDQKSIEICQNIYNTSEMVRKLVQFAQKNGSKDNISVLALKF